MISRPQAERLVDAIFRDLCGRSRLDSAFARCDHEIQLEIREAWIRILLDGKGADPPYWVTEDE